MIVLADPVLERFFDDGFAQSFQLKEKEVVERQPTSLGREIFDTLWTSGVNLAADVGRRVRARRTDGGKTVAVKGKDAVEAASTASTAAEKKPSTTTSTSSVDMSGQQEEKTKVESPIEKAGESKNSTLLGEDEEDFVDNLTSPEHGLEYDENEDNVIEEVGPQEYCN